MKNILQVIFASLLFFIGCSITAFGENAAEANNVYFCSNLIEDDDPQLAKLEQVTGLDVKYIDKEIPKRENNDLTYIHLIIDDDRVPDCQKFLSKEINRLILLTFEESHNFPDVIGGVKLSKEPSMHIKYVRDPSLTIVHLSEATGHELLEEISVAVQQMYNSGLTK